MRRALSALAALAAAAASAALAPTSASAAPWLGSAACQWANAQETVSGTSVPYTADLQQVDDTAPPPETLRLDIPAELVPTMIDGERYIATGDGAVYTVVSSYGITPDLPTPFFTVQIGSPTADATYEDFDGLRPHEGTFFAGYVESGDVRIVDGQVVQDPPPSLGPITLDISCVPGPPPATGLELSPYASPIDTGILNTAKAGRTIPFKFSASIGGEPVLDLTNDDVTLVAKPFNCLASSEVGDPVEVYATNSSGLQSFGDGTYQLNMKTSRAWSGCYRLGLTVRDVTQTEDFRF